MSTLAARAAIKDLPRSRQSAFRQFYHQRLQERILPVITDFALLAMLVNAVVNIAIQYAISNSWASVHPLALLYLGCFLLLAVSHRLSGLRFRAPLTVYLIYAIAATFAYRDFIIENGWLEPLYGLFLLLAFVGYLCISIRHSLLILAANFLVLVFTHILVYGTNNYQTHLGSLLSQRYVIACIFTAITSIFFVRWLFSNLLASQFLLNEKNTQLQETFRVLEATESQLIQQQKQHALNLMAKGLLHEIINPVNSSIQALGFAQSVNEDEDVAEALEEALNQQKRISAIISDLRTFSREEADKQTTRTRIDELIDNAVGLCHREIKSQQIELSQKIPDALYLDCHPTAVIQVFVNVILNATHALSNKSRESGRSLSITCEEDEEQIHIVFLDNGVGIPDNILPLVTTPFFKRTEQAENLGLGLSICQTIMRHHNGSLEITSKDGEWTAVRLSFPSSIELKTEKQAHNFTYPALDK